MSEATSVQEPGLVQSPSPPWIDILARVASQISGGRQIRGSGPSSLDGTSRALARAHSQFLVALGSDSRIGRDTISQSATQAVELLVTVARLWGTLGARADERRAWLTDQLRRRLATHEDDVLAAEVTYSVWAEYGEQPSAAMRQALASLSRGSTASEADLRSLSIAAVDLASLLVRLAANAAVSGRGTDAPDERSPALDAKLAAVAAELAARSRELTRPLANRHDVIAHHLAGGLGVRLPETRKQSGGGSAVTASDATDLGRLRAAWLRLATREYAAAAALDGGPETPSRDQSYARLATAITDGAASVICGARLSRRPAAFRHARAWRRQMAALSYALEAYVAGLGGHAPSLARARRIVQTRLVRATVAIVLIDLRADALGADESR